MKFVHKISSLDKPFGTALSEELPNSEILYRSVSTLWELNILWTKNCTFDERFESLVVEDERKLQIILDIHMVYKCTKNNVDAVLHIEHHCRRLCYSLHTHRYKLFEHTSNKEEVWFVAYHLPGIIFYNF